MKRILTDGQTIVDLWYTNDTKNFSSQHDTNIYISVSNLLFSRYYYSEILKEISKLGIEATNNFVNQNIILDEFLYHDATDRYISYFLKNEKIFSDRIVIDSINNIGIILFKNLTIDSGETDVSPVISETIGLIAYLKSRNDTMPLISVMPELKQFISEFNIDL